MYKLQEHEGLYRVSDNKYIVANYVEIESDRVVCEHRYEFRGQEIVRRNEYPLGEVGIFWDEDHKDRCSRPLWMSFDIYFFHESLYEYGFLHDDEEDFAIAGEDFEFEI